MQTQSERSKNCRDKKRARGLCIECGLNPPLKDRAKCVECLSDTSFRQQKSKRSKQENASHT